MIARLVREEEGQSLVEYGLLVALIALVVIGAVTLFGNKVGAMWNGISNQYPGTPP